MNYLLHLPLLGKLLPEFLEFSIYDGVIPKLHKEYKFARLGTYKDSGNK